MVTIQYQFKRPANEIMEYKSSFLNCIYYIIRIHNILQYSTARSWNGMDFRDQHLWEIAKKILNTESTVTLTTKKCHNNHKQKHNLYGYGQW